MRYIPASLEKVLDDGVIRPRFVANMTLSNNRSFSPIVTSDDMRNIDAIVDGVDSTSMTFALTDSVHRTDDWARVWPVEKDDPLVPWISSSRYSDRTDTWTDGKPRITVDYGRLVRCNAIKMAFDKMIAPSYITVKVHDGTMEKVIADNLPVGDERLTLYLQSDGSWSTAKEIDNATLIQKVTVVIHSVSPIVPGRSAAVPAHIREIDACLIVDISDDIISVDIDESRDLGVSNASTFGVSSANTASITLSNHDNRYNNENIDSPYWGMLIPGVRVDVSMNIKVADRPPPSFVTTGLKAWYDASRMSAADGSPVSTWQDMVSGNNLTQNSGSAQPVYRSSAFNGKPCLQFDGVNDYMISQRTMLDNRSATIFAVVAPDEAGDGAWIYGQIGWPEYKFIWNNNNTFLLNFQSTIGSVSMQSDAITVGTTHITTAILDSRNGYLRVDGAEHGRVLNRPPEDIASRQFRVGVRDPNISPFFGGRIAEILIYDRVLTEPEYLAVERYLSDKWGIPLSKQNPVKIPLGVFYVDTWNVSDDTSTVEISCRDASRFIQDKTTTQLFYVNETIKGIVRDVLERCGIDDYRITVTDIDTDRSDHDVGNADIIDVADTVCIPKRHLVWSDSDKTYWQFLQEIALSDLAVFYFDESGKFHFVSKDTSLYEAIDVTKPDIPDMIAWFRCDEHYGVIDDGMVIPYLTDFSGNDNHAYVRVGNPTLIYNGINNRPSMRVNGIQAMGTNVLNNITNEVTIAVVTRYHSSPTSTEASVVNCQTNTTPGVSIKGDPNDFTPPHAFRFQLAEASGSTVQYTTPDSYANGDAVCLVATLSRHGVLRFYVNDEYMGSATRSTTSPLSFNRIYIGSPLVSGSFDIGEVMIFSRRLGDDEIESVTNYLMHRWGISDHADETAVVASIDDDKHLVSATVSHELPRNDITISYSIPTLSKKRVGLWQAENPTILDTTTLGGDISKHDTIIPAGDISDWYKSGWIKIEDEIIKYNSRTDSAFTDCERGAMDTEPAPHKGGTPIREIREIDVDYSLAPATDFSILNTNEEYTEIIASEFGPFRARLMLLNTSAGKVIVQGTHVDRALEGLPEAVVLAGRAIEQPEERQIHKVNKSAINKWGDNKLQLSVPWIQSQKHAESLADFIIAAYSNPATVIDSSTITLPHLSIGDVVRVKHQRFRGINKKRYFIVIGRSIRGSADSFDMTLKLRSRPKQYPLPDKSWAPMESPPFTYGWDPAFDEIPKDFIIARFAADGIVADVSDISTNGLEILLDANTLMQGLSDSNNVTSWSDSSGNNRTATASTSSSPQYHQRGFFGKPGVFFSGSISMQFTLPNLSIATIVFVGRYTSSSFTVNSSIFFGDANPRIGILTDLNDTSTPHSIRFASSGFTTDFDIGTPDIYHHGQPFIAIGVYDGSSAKFYVDGTKIGESVASSHNLYQIWRLGTPSQTARFQCSEVRIYSRVLDETEIRQLTRFLSVKWGIIDDEPYDNEVVRYWYDQISGGVMK